MTHNDFLNLVESGDVERTLSCLEKDENLLNKLTAQMPTNELQYRALYAHPRMVKVLRDRGLSFNQASSSGQTPLWMALVLSVDEPMIRALLDSDADPNLGPARTSPLHAALGSPSLVRLLIERGADPNRPIDASTTVLHEAIGRKIDGYRNAREVIMALIEGGADPEYRVGALGETPIEMAQRRNLVELADEMKIFKNASLAHRSIKKQVTELVSAPPRPLP